MNNNIEDSLKQINNKLNKLTICDKYNKKYTLEKYINMLEHLKNPKKRSSSRIKGGRKKNKSKKSKRSKRSRTRSKRSKTRSRSKR